MKKMMFVAAMAAMVLSSCSKQQTVDDATITRGAIGFESFVGKATKAIETSTWANGATIRVTGYATDAAITSTTNMIGLNLIEGLTNKTVTYASATQTWSYSPLVYWEDGKYHSFFATAVSGANSGFEDGKVRLAVSNLVETQIDMMVSDPVRQTTAYVKGSNPPAVTFTMRHILSQVLFKAKIAVEDAAVTGLKVKSITITPKSGEFVTNGFVDVAGKVNATDPNVVTVAPQDPVTTPSYTLTPTNAVTVNEATYTDIKHQANHVAMLLPQPAPEFTVSVVVNGTGITGDVTITFDAPQIIWEPNKKYVYKLDINVPVQVLNKESILIGDPMIEGWDSAVNEEETTPNL